MIGARAEETAYLSVFADSTVRCEGKALSLRRKKCLARVQAGPPEPLCRVQATDTVDLRAFCSGMCRTVSGTCACVSSLAAHLTRPDNRQSARWQQCGSSCNRTEPNGIGLTPAARSRFRLVFGRFASENERIRMSYVRLRIRRPQVRVLPSALQNTCKCAVLTPSGRPDAGIGSTDGILSDGSVRAPARV
jgi:hypothetical protein